MKRIFALFLILALTLCACAKSEHNKESTPESSSATDKLPENSESQSEESCSHADDDDNGICDRCEKSVNINVDFFAINDLHGKVTDSSTQPGLDELTTYLKNQIREKDNVILLSSGDTWQGTAESNSTHGALITEWMNEMNFVSMTLGNHEFDWGENRISENYKLANFPFLAINIYNKSTNKPVEYVKPSTLIEQNGLKIGIIGAIGNCYSSIEAGKTENIYFKTGSELTELVKNESKNLRSLGADIIIYSIHGGWSGSNTSVQDADDRQLAGHYDISLSDGYVDLVFEGHTHKSYVLKDRYGVYHLQGGGDNVGISHVSLTVNVVKDKCVVSKAEFIHSNSYKDLRSDVLIEDLLDKYKESIADTYRVLGKNAASRNANYLRNLLARLYYEKGIEKWGDKYDIALGGAYMSVRSPRVLDKGDVTYAKIQTLFPFDNDLALCTIKGHLLKYNFFETSNSNYFIFYGEYGASIKDNIDPNQTYYVITDSYTYTYAPNNMTVIEMLGENIYPRDLLAAYIEEGGLEK